MLTNGGTCTTRPVSSFAGLTCALAVARLMPGTVSTTFRSTAEDFDVDVDLLVAVRIHEMERIVVAVEVLHLPLVEDRAFDVFFRAELIVPLDARADVPHLGLDEPALVARREVLQIKYPEQIVLELDEHPPLEARCLN